MHLLLQQKCIVFVIFFTKNLFSRRIIKNMQSRKLLYVYVNWTHIICGTRPSLIYNIYKKYVVLLFDSVPDNITFDSWFQVFRTFVRRSTSRYVYTAQYTTALLLHVLYLLVWISFIKFSLKLCGNCMKLVFECILRLFYSNMFALCSLL